MEAIQITIQPETEAQLDAVKAFFKALKIKHTIKKEATKMSKEEYYTLLNKRISNSKKNKSILVDAAYQKEILFEK